MQKNQEGAHRTKKKKKNNNQFESGIESSGPRNILRSSIILHSPSQAKDFSKRGEFTARLRLREVKRLALAVANKGTQYTDRKICSLALQSNYPTNALANHIITSEGDVYSPTFTFYGNMWLGSLLARPEGGFNNISATGDLGL